MHRRNNLLCLFIALLSFLVLPCALAQTAAQPDAREELNKGAASYRSAMYEDAVQHFRNAVALDPTFLNAHLYLATAYAQMFVPGLESPENQSYAENAIAEYKAVLERDSQNVNSMKGIAYLYLTMRQWEPAKDYYQRAIEADPQDPENYYSIGFIDWTQAYTFRMNLRNQSGLKPMDSAIDNPICSTIRQQNWDIVQHAIEMLDKAIKLRPDYDDAMAYLNLMYRERADMRCGDHPAHDADTKLADEWVDKTIATLHAKDVAAKSTKQ